MIWSSNHSQAPACTPTSTLAPRSPIGPLPLFAVPCPTTPAWRTTSTATDTTSVWMTNCTSMSATPRWPTMSPLVTVSLLPMWPATARPHYLHRKTPSANMRMALPVLDTLPTQSHAATTSSAPRVATAHTTRTPNTFSAARDCTSTTRSSRAATALMCAAPWTAAPVSAWHTWTCSATARDILAAQPESLSAMEPARPITISMNATRAAHPSTTTTLPVLLEWPKRLLPPNVMES